MDWGAVDYGLVRRMAVESLGPAAAKHSKSLFVDVCLVFLSAKPALLLDCVCTDLIPLAAFVASVEQYLKTMATSTTTTTTSPGILSPVRILKIEEDLVVIEDAHYRRVENQLSQGGGSKRGVRGGAGSGGGERGRGGSSDDDGDSSRSSLKSIVFVDVTGTLGSPRLLDDETRANLLEWIALTFANATAVDTFVDPAESESESESRGIPLVDFSVASHHEGRCVPSLFGVLLGYPVVYFSSTDDNCLAFTPLKLISLTCRTDSGFEHDCFSFSIPGCLYDDDDDNIVASLRSDTKRLTHFFSSVRLRVKEITQNSISL